jgi:hypothetical protein
MRNKSVQHNEGIALLVATIFVAIAVLVLGALAMRVVQQNNQSAQYKLFNETFTGVEAAVARSWVEIEAGQDGQVGLGTWSLPAPGTGVTLPDFGDEDVAPETSPTQPSVEYMAYADNWAANGIDDDGDGTVDGVEELRCYTIFGMASNRGIARTAELVIKGWDVNVWRNAIFAGAGQAGGLINGNVSIHGSVHLLGQNVLPGQTAISAIDLSGTSLIHNNYTGLVASLADRVPPLPVREFNGESVGTLNAKLRVRNGLVAMSGTSEIGEPNVSGNTLKETMDGVFVNDGYTGTSVTDDGDRGDPTALFSDNGWDQRYELGDKIPMPLFTDDYREKDTGTTYVNPSTLANFTHEDYFEQVLTGTPYPGDLTISAATDFYYNATRPAETDSSLRLPTDDYILFNATTNLMEINGQIQVDGNLLITRGGGNDKTINYTGRAALLVHGDAVLDTDLLSVNANGTTANSFPVNNIFGIMAERNLTVGSLSQLQLMGAFYAQGTVRSVRQTTIMGTLVGGYFDMGTNVPDIYQVPDLPDNLPLGMIGAYPIIVYAKVSWRELGT